MPPLSGATTAASLQALAALKGPVDEFFDHVMVNVDDATLRTNRGLLAILHAAMNRVADLSKALHMKLVILDRDGVINRDSDQFIKSPEEWLPLPGSLEAIARLTQWGYRVVVATNQSGVGRGLFDMGTLNAIHDKMIKAVALAGGRIDSIFFCPHAAESTCECRKPRPGMLREVAMRYSTDLNGVPAIGDSLRDLQAAAGGRTAHPGADRQGREDA